jgi:hypothetical protein
VTYKLIVGQVMSLEKKSHFDEIECANDVCLNIFTPKTYNAIFCSPECRKVVTNRKLLDKYYLAKENKNKKRTCLTDTCSTILSRYNKENICEACKVERYIKRLSGWGWSEQKLRDEFK